MKVRQCSVRDAAVLVAEAMALPMPEPKPAREKPQTDIADKVSAMAGQSKSGQSAYLTSKGLQCPLPLLSDGSLLLVLCNASGAVCGAQVIKPDGGKRLVAGTVKKALSVCSTPVDRRKRSSLPKGLPPRYRLSRCNLTRWRWWRSMPGTFRPLPQCYAKNTLMRGSS